MNEQYTDKNNKTLRGSKGASVVNVILAILAILVIGGVLYFIFRKKPASNTASDTADSIRNAFQSPPSNSTSTSSFTPPNPTVATPTVPQIPQTATNNPSVGTSGNFGSSSQNTGSGQTTQPRSTQPYTGTARNSAPVTPRTQYAQRTPTVAAPAPTVYNDQNNRFQLSLPSNWVVGTGSGPNTVAVFNRQTGQMIGYVEVYNNSNETLDSLSRIFQGSPSVTNVSQTSVNGIPAVAFNSATSEGSGIAMVYNNKIYYLRGGLANPGNMNVFRFI